MLAIATVGTWPSTIVACLFAGLYPGAFHDHDESAKLPVGWVSVTVQMVPAGYSGLRYGVAWVTVKFTGPIPPVQV